MKSHKIFLSKHHNFHDTLSNNFHSTIIRETILQVDKSQTGASLGFEPSQAKFRNPRPSAWDSEIFREYEF